MLLCSPVGGGIENSRLHRARLVHQHQANPGTVLRILADLEVASPYNTYRVIGLPPGPICTPTVASIDAALAPDTRGGYLFFLAKKDGTTIFSKTYAEHLQAIQKYGT